MTSSGDPLRQIERNSSFEPMSGTPFSVRRNRTRDDRFAFKTKKSCMATRICSFSCFHPLFVLVQFYSGFSAGFGGAAALGFPEPFNLVLLVIGLSPLGLPSVSWGRTHEDVF